jgi:predicted Zn-dependent protease
MQGTAVRGGVMKICRGVAALVAAAFLCSCATSTAPGAIGVTRQQLLMLPVATVNAQAAEGFSRLSGAAKAAGKLNSDAAVVARVRTIGQDLIREVPAFRSDAVHWAWEINVFDSPQVNAFCAPGGKIGVFTGIINRLELTDDELAAVMGHEIAHALREHSREKASQGLLSRAIVQGIANSGSRNAGTAAAITNVSAQLFLHLPFSRDMELEADAMGIELMARAGYDPKAAPNVWRKMQTRVGGSGAEFFATHPNHERRIDELEAALPKVQQLYAVAATKRPASVAVTVPPKAVTPIAMPGQMTLVPPGATSLVGEKVGAVTKNEPVGQESYTVERMARSEGCHSTPRAVLTAKGAGFETYTVACSSGEVWSVRCDFGQCRVLK